MIYMTEIKLMKFTIWYANFKKRIRFGWKTCQLFFTNHLSLGCKVGQKNFFFLPKVFFRNSRAGVSNTQSASRMWPARCICAASDHLKHLHYYKFWSFSELFVVCGPHKLFPNKLWPAEHFFFEMWPSDTLEFETLALELAPFSKIIVTHFHSWNTNCVCTLSHHFENLRFVTTFGKILVFVVM